MKRGALYLILILILAGIGSAIIFLRAINNISIKAVAMLFLFTFLPVQIMNRFLTQ
jgi:hypothetical protein